MNHHSNPRGADVIVVGAGAAGCLLAERLSADPACQVVLIEAGSDRRPMEAKIPAGFPKLFNGPLDWGHHTVAQPGLAGRSLYWPRGKALGGSAAINAQVWNHLDPVDAAAWRTAVPGAFDAEAVEGATRRIDQVMNLDGQRDPSELSSAFIASCADRGLRTTADLNDGLGGDRVGAASVMQRRGARYGAREAWLEPARRRSNLSVVVDALVERLILDARGRASGVEIVVGGVRRQITAGRGVVVAAGAIGSPHLLQLSGIGPAAHLAAVGIRPQVDLPAVGAHLQDHLMSIVVALTDGHVRTLKDAERPSQLVSYLFRRRGMLTSNVAEALAFARTSSTLPAPDVELVFAPVMFLDHGQVAPPVHGVSIGTVLLTPLSEGTVLVRSSDPATAPAIDPRYLSDPGGRDLAALGRGVEMAIETMNSGPLSRHVTGFHEPVGRTAEPVDHIRRRAETIYHPVGTCRMGADPRDTVVDADFSVHGVSGLWVADASVMPVIPRCHTTAPTMLLAELAAARISGTPRMVGDASLVHDG